MDHSDQKPQLKNNFLNDSDFKKFLNQSTRYIPGSPSYWYSERKNLEAMVDQLGLPTIFFTQSSADTRNSTID